MAGTMKIRYGRRIDSFNIIIADTISFIVPFLKVVLLNDTKWNQRPLAFEPGLSSRYCFSRDKVILLQGKLEYSDILSRLCFKSM